MNSLGRIFIKVFAVVSFAALSLISTNLYYQNQNKNQNQNYPQILLSGKNFQRVTDVRQFDKVSSELRTYLRTQANGVRVPIKLERAYTFQSNDSLYLVYGRSIADYPMRPTIVSKIYSIVKQNMPNAFKNKKVAIFTNGSKLEHLITPYYNSKNSYHKIQSGESAPRKHTKSKERLKELLNRPYSISNGLQDRHIAMSNSHGWYYEPTLDRWEFQRARLFGVVEDTYTMSYVVPFLVPMLENAGAVVLMPKERDWRKEEVIVDNDTHTQGYSEKNGAKKWEKGKKEGFAHPKQSYIFGENPFKMGSYVQADVVAEGEDNQSQVVWTPDIPESGDYAVYISYHSLPNSTDKARYKVVYSAGDAEFSVNQKIGGGMWVYLGTFHFTQGVSEQGVYLTNVGGSGVVTADGCKFGGGMGNIARGKGEGFISGMPRFMEGARYYLQWSGFADTVYSASHNENDYTDDYVSRGKWVNNLAGGSYKLPKWGAESKGIPIDLSFAFHTDAGNALSDTIIGTLSIFTRECKDFGAENPNLYPNGEDRMWGRYLADIVQTQLVDDISNLYEFAWSRRGLWDRSYSESRTPQVPGMLLEFLSHHNYADMKFGLDPDFRFHASRAIYKGILKFLAFKNRVPYTVQPLPVKNMMAEFITNRNEPETPYVQISWKGVEDPIEPTAEPKGYMVYIAENDGGYDMGHYTENEYYVARLEKDKVYRFKVAAVNDGGESFASEVVAAGMPSDRKNNVTVLIVNAFDRVGAPKWMQSKDSTIAGFFPDYDHGVPYIKDASYLGKMYEYRRSVPWTDDDAPGFGACYNNEAGNIIAGNTFDYAYDHGLAFMRSGYGFISCTRSAIEEDKIDMSLYPICDIIMGKQVQSNNGSLTEVIKYEVYTPKMREAIAKYCADGRALLLSGAYVATDLVDSYKVDESGAKFAADVLKIKWMTHSAAKDGRVSAVMNDFGFNGNFEFYSTLNDKKYLCEAPDAFVPAGDDSYTIFRYPQTSISAAVAYPGKDYKAVIFGFPIETLKEQSQIDTLIAQVLNFLTK